MDSNISLDVNVMVRPNQYYCLLIRNMESGETMTRDGYTFDVWEFKDVIEYWETDVFMIKYQIVDYQIYNLVLLED
jgi:hypothetical protein